eukprot:1141134-Pelagomonas_calceolata.AAC.8
MATPFAPHTVEARCPGSAGPSWVSRKRRARSSTSSCSDAIRHCPSMELRNSSKIAIFSIVIGRPGSAGLQQHMQPEIAVGVQDWQDRHHLLQCGKTHPLKLGWAPTSKDPATAHRLAKLSRPVHNDIKKENADRLI